MSLEARRGNRDVAEVFRALGDPTRLAIFELIRTSGGPHTAGEIRTGVSALANHLGISPSTASHHIRELRRAGLIRCERRGQTVACSIAEEALAEIRSYLTVAAPTGDESSSR